MPSAPSDRPPFIAVLSLLLLMSMGLIAFERMLDSAWKVIAPAVLIMPLAVLLNTFWIYRNGKRLLWSDGISADVEDLNSDPATRTAPSAPSCPV